MKNTIESILIISYNPTFCKYYINNGEQHLCSYDNIRKLLMGITPTLVLQIEYFLERKLSFFISINDLKIQEVSTDLDKVIQQMKKDKFELNFKNIQDFMKNIEDDKHLPNYQSQAESVTNRYFRNETINKRK